MKRTYRSKKDTGGALDPREVLLNMDEKSSAFDAFYIQNLKQTKRELSCVGSSNAYGISSNKVRKRKYVKRIVKDVENIQPRKSSASTYLTPDKSIRVNKIQDPFDMLLNSSPVDIAISQDAEKDLDLLPEKESKPYIRNKIRKAIAKKFNHSSYYSSDSDKENTSDKISNANMTDIRTHELLVENEPCKSPKFCDESINKFVNNLSLINKYKTGNSSFNTSYKYRNKLMKKGQSPILQKSPLCSTPFKDKYRGKSIYNLSPITTKNKGSSNYITISEDNNKSISNIIIECNTHSTISPKQSSLLASLPMKETAKKLNSKSIIYEDDDFASLACEFEKYNESASNEQSLIQITEAEPFLGFSNEVNDSKAKNRNYLLKCIDGVILEILDTSLEYNSNDKGMLQQTLQKCSFDGSRNKNDVNHSTVHKDINTSNETCDSDSSNFSLISEESERESVYDTCNSEHSFSEEVKNEKFEPRVAIERMNDSVFIKYYANLINKENISSCCQSIPSDNILDHVSGDEHFSDLDDMENNNDESQCTTSTDYINNSTVDDDKLSDLGDLDEIINNFEENQHYGRRPINDANKSLDNEVSDLKYEHPSDSDLHVIQNNNDESQCHDSKPIHSNKKSDDKEDNLTDENQSELGDLHSNIDDSQSYEINSFDDVYKSVFELQDNISSSSKSTESDSVEIQTNEIVLSDYSTTEDFEERESNDEKYVSFVTTRRRNEIANDSLFIFDRSYGSSSTDCDKTILSNKARLSCFGNIETGLDISVDEGNVPHKNVNGLIEVEFSITTKNSLRLTGQTEVNTDLDYSTNDITVVGTEEILDTKGKEPSPNLDATTPEHRLSHVRTSKSSRMCRDSILDTSRADSEIRPSIVLQPGKKWERSLSIYRRVTTIADHFDQSFLEDEGSLKKGRRYRQSVISTMEMQDSQHNESINSRRSTFLSKPNRSTIRFVKDSNNSRISLNTTEVFDDLKGFLNEECDDTVIELSKLSLADSEFEVTVLDNFHEPSERIATARDYVLHRCNQTEPIQFDECYPKTVLKNCHKIGEGVYGEVFLWRANDGRARVMKIVPIAGAVKVNGEQQKDYHEVISEIVIAMELSALRAPIADIDRYFDEGKDGDALDLHSVENGTDVFNEVLAVRCVQGPYPSRLLDLWELYDECKGSENDNPAALPDDQQYIVLELANAGQDLESYQFTGAQQAHALFQQIAFGLAVGEESFQFEHRDLHWGNVLIAPTEQKFATFVVRGRTHRVARGGVAATIIDYSLSRISLPLGAEQAALYNDLAQDEQLFEAVGDYQFQVYRLMRDKLRNDWKNFEPYTNILWLHYTVDKMITALRYKRTTTKIHKHYIEKLKGIKERILDYKSATDYVLTDIEI